MTLSTVLAVLSLAMSVATIVVASRTRKYRIRAEAAAERAQEILKAAREQRITQHLESSGGCSRLVIGDREVDVQVRTDLSPAEVGKQVAQALRRPRRGEAGS